MELEFRADPSAEMPELFIHLDVEGLAAFFKVIEQSMRTGIGVMSAEACGPGAIIIGSSSPHAFSNVTITFDRPGSGRGGKMPN